MSEERKLPDGWDRQAVGDIGPARTKNIVPANTPDDEFELWSVPAFPSGIPEIVKGKDVGSNKQYVQNGDVLLCKINPRINRVWKVNGDSSRHQIASTEWVVFRGQAEPDFILNFFRSPEFRRALLADVAGVGGSLTRARPQAIKQIPLPIAPLNEQKRIVAKIEALQARSRAAKGHLDQVPALLDKLRQSVLAAAFRGDLTKEWREKNPDVEPASVLLERIKKERAREKQECSVKYRFKVTSDLDSSFVVPSLPSTWMVTNIDNVCMYIVDCLHSTPKWTDCGKLCLRTTNFLRNRLDLSEVKYVSDATYTERISRLKPRVGDILYSREGGILGIACPLEISEEVCLGQRMMMFRCSEHTQSRLFCYYLNSPLVTTHISGLVGGSASPHINIGDIKKMPYLLPPNDEQLEIERILRTYMARIDQLEVYLSELDCMSSILDESILMSAFRGELVS